MIFQILVWWWLWRYKVAWSQALVFSTSSCPHRLSFVQQHQIWEAFSASLLFWWAEMESSAECARCEASLDLSSARCGCAGCPPAEQLCIVLRRRRLLPSLSLLRQQLRKLYSPHHFHENLHFPQARARADSIQALLWRPRRHARPRQGDHQTALFNERKNHLWSQACLLGSNLTLPICDGRVTLGTWQVSFEQPPFFSIPLIVSGSNLG